MIKSWLFVKIRITYFCQTSLVKTVDAPKKSPEAEERVAEMTAAKTIPTIQEGVS